jgi:hypothetical protein
VTIPSIVFQDVIPAKAGIQTIFGHCIDSGFCRNDKGGKIILNWFRYIGHRLMIILFEMRSIIAGIANMAAGF